MVFVWGMNRSRVFATLVAILALLPAAGAATVHGHVFEDRNGNGIRDPGEPGLAQVAVSDGATVVLTNAEGRYELPAIAGSTVFVIKPRDWSSPVDAQNLPQFYRRLEAANPPAEIDFPLLRHAEADVFRALVLTDPQPGSLTEVGYLAQTIVAGLAPAQGIAFGITLGDLVNNRHELYAPVNQVMARVGVPWYNLGGNHDLDFGAAGDRQAFATFESVYGPTTFAFHYGPALFVALNDVRYLGGPRYVGGLREDQFAFLEQLLRTAPHDEPVVLLMHIPWFYPNPSNAATFRPADRARLFSLLQDRPHNFWLTGHTHYQRHVFHGPADGWQGAQPLEEYNVAAACGSFWGGPPDASGIPIATMWDGTPHGYAVLTVSGAGVRAEYRPARFPASHQIGLHAPRAVAPGRGFVSFYANVFNGHEGWKIEAHVDDRGWAPLDRVIEWDPAYAQLYLAQDTAAQPLAPPRLPDPTVCYHLWRGSLPADLPLGAHKVEVRATNPDGQTFTAACEVRVVAPAP